MRRAARGCLDPAGNCLLAYAKSSYIHSLYLSIAVCPLMEGNNRDRCILRFFRRRGNGTKLLADHGNSKSTPASIAAARKANSTTSLVTIPFPLPLARLHCLDKANALMHRPSENSRSIASAADVTVCTTSCLLT